MKKHMLLASILLCAGISLNAMETTTEVKEETKKEEVLPVKPVAPVAKEEETPAPVAKQEEMEEVDLSDIDLDVEEPTE